MGQRRMEIALAFAGFIGIGLGGGATGVLLPAQIDEYGVNKSVIGLLFFTFSGGYVLAGALNGWLLRRLRPARCRWCSAARSSLPPRSCPGSGRRT